MTREEVRKKRPKRAPGVQLGEATARAMILQGAARVFAQRGVRAASVEHILGAAKVSRRTFYRFYQSKEDVLVALYRTGTEGLLEACRVAAREERAPLRRLERCVDVHLLHARGLGRLIYVLGGEAQRSESALHARRRQVHEELAQLLSQGCLSAQPSGSESGSESSGQPRAQTAHSKASNHLTPSRARRTGNKSQTSAVSRPEAEGASDDGRVDAWIFRGLILALEGLTRLALEEGDEGRAVTNAALGRVKRAVMRMAEAALADAHKTGRATQ